MPRVFVGIGSNIDREASVRGGVEALRRHYGDVQLSSVYESEAVGFEGDPFYNLVAAFDTEEEVETVVANLGEIETQHGRIRHGERFVSRTLDLDLLLYGDAVLRNDKYHVPRDEIEHYAFVLWPLAEIAPDRRHPQTGKTFAEMWESFDKNGPGLRPIPFQW
jgi:2-amino-4-hydroxy-6-hydroxymethyldihydropteridine diphosphokinase